MTKNKIKIIITVGFIAIIGTIYWMQSSPTKENILFSQKRSSPQHQVNTTLSRSIPDMQAPTIEGRKIIGVPLGRENEALKTIKISNTVSPQWKERLKEVLKKQAGENLKEIDVTKVESYIWQQDGHAFNVESVVISLKNDKGEESKFRALVDSQSGRIIESWDRPVSDPLDSRDDFRIKIDPRYSN